MGPVTAFSPAFTPSAAPGAWAPARVLAAALCALGLALSAFAGAGAALAAGNLTINSNMTISSNAEYNDITGSGTQNLTVTGARVTANDIRCATVHMLARNAVITATQNFRMGPMYVENSTLTAGNIFQSSATGRMVTDNSHIDAGVISLGWDYLLNQAAPPTDGPHQHNNSVLTAKTSIMLYGGLEVVSGDTVVTCDTGNISARMVDGLTQRPGATLTLEAPQGKITAQTIVATNLRANSLYANNVTMEGGTFTLTGPLAASANQNVITEGLTLEGSTSSIAGLSVGGPAVVSGGTLTGGELEAHRGLTVNDHARAPASSPWRWKTGPCSPSTAAWRSGSSGIRQTPAPLWAIMRPSASAPRMRTGSCASSTPRTPAPSAR